MSGAHEKAGAYVIPFAVLMAMLVVGNTLALDPRYWYPVRTVAVAAALIVFSRSALRLRPQRPWASMAVGVAVFLVWAAPDALWPGYRDHWLFRNSLVGEVAGAGTAAAASSLTFLIFRVTGASLVVPLAEELFWRGWLMRWLIAPEFWRTPIGTYTARAFWITALLFASEHGLYWDVGLAAGVIYNAWIVRTRSLADVILAHGVTNAVLAAYVLRFGKWEYW